MFSLILAWTNVWANNGDAGDLRRHRAHYDVIVMTWKFPLPSSLVQECSNSSALAMESLQSCTKPSKREVWHLPQYVELCFPYRPKHNVFPMLYDLCRDHSGFVLSQWETSLVGCTQIQNDPCYNNVIMWIFVCHSLSSHLVLNIVMYWFSGAEGWAVPPGRDIFYLKKSKNYKKLRHFLKIIRSWVENECRCSHTGDTHFKCWIYE